MATSAPQASQAWHQALKLRKHLLKQLEKLRASSAAGIDISQFEDVDDLLEKFRLACVHTIFLDFEYAVAENTEEALWALHTSINSEYRRTLGRLKHSSHAVEKRKVEKMYNNFLRIAQKFYKGYIQRLSARFDVYELKRAAQGIEVEQLTAEDTISPVPAELSRKVLRSCHSTLLRLGDLARYRIQARHKNSGYETALTYYSLAHHLMPSSGFAFHQMGIVNLDQGNHMDVVYHFYRAWAVETPHPNAKPNLEAEFKVLQQPKTQKPRNSTTGPQDVFIMWFVRLHALFYKGQIFQEQAELEGEVIHRLEMAARTATSADTLLKMALVNMSAYDVAFTIHAEKQTQSSLRFREYALSFNARFLLTFCGTLESDLKEAISTDKDEARKAEAAKLTPTVECLLPVLRAYCMWLAARRHEIFDPAHAVGSIVPKMVHNLARVFTLLCVKTYNEDNLATSPYLLSEDLEIRGFRPLGEGQVPEACRCYCDENGTLKPYLQDPKGRLDTSGEDFARILDILRCAYFLAEDCSTPLSYRVAESWLVFEYQPDAKQQQPVPETNHSQNETFKAPTNREEGIDRNMPAPSVEQQAFSQPGAIANDQTLDPVQHQSSYSLPAEVDEAESTVINMLAPFLRPPTPQALQDSQTPRDSSSYGMHTMTANENFGSSQTDLSPSKSIPSGKFEQLPWAWFDTPKPQQVEDPTSAASREAFASPRSVAHSPRNSIAAGKPLEDPFATPGRGSSGSLSRQQGVVDSRSPVDPSSENAHRNHLLQSFTNAGTPRASSFSHWAQHPGTARQQQASAEAPWGQNADNAPASSGTSGFSHPSSLYQGTPMNGAQYGAQYGVAGSGDSARGQSQYPSQRDRGSASGRHFQMDDTTLSYDEAVLRRAYYEANDVSNSAQGGSSTRNIAPHL